MEQLTAIRIEVESLRLGGLTTQTQVELHGVRQWLRDSDQPWTGFDESRLIPSSGTPPTIAPRHDVVSDFVTDSSLCPEEGILTSVDVSGPLHQDAGISQVGRMMNRLGDWLGLRVLPEPRQQGPDSHHRTLGPTQNKSDDEFMEREEKSSG